MFQVCFCKLLDISALNLASALLYIFKTPGFNTLNAHGLNFRLRLLLRLTRGQNFDGASCFLGFALARRTVACWWSSA
jgi:hypothetical protein